jgi:hypothetical protein
MLYAILEFIELEDASRECVILETANLPDSIIAMNSATKKTTTKME